MTEALQAMRVAIRSLTRSRRFTILTVVTLAFGIGITTAFFSVFDAILLRPLAYGDAERLVTVLEPGRSPTSPINYVELRDGASSLENLTAASPWQPVLRGEGPAEQLSGLKASRDLFALLGVKPMIGRTFAAGDSSEPVMVLSHELWQQRFGADEGVLGRDLELDGVSHTVIGVMPPGFLFPPFWATDARFWTPYDDPDMWSREGRFLRVFGRLADGAELTTAQSEVDVLARALAAEYPDSNTDLVYKVEAMSEPVVEGIRPALQTILFGVGLVLLIAVANVGSLWLTRTAGRGQELAVRRVLGAHGWELWRQGLAESLCVVVLAAGLGWTLALWGLEALKAMAPIGVPRLAEATLDGRVFGFTFGVAAVLALVFALLLPASNRRQLARSLAGGTRRLGTRQATRGRALLVTGEIAMALMLLLASGLMARSLLHLWRLDPGLRTEGVLTVQLPFGGSPIEAPEEQERFFDRLLERMAALPGVESAALINHLHLGGDIWGFPFEVEGHPEENSSTAPSASFRVVSEGLFETFDIPLIEGRAFERGDDAEGPPVVIINRRLAETHWPGESAVGRRIGDFSDDRTWFEVVGVAGDVQQWTLTQDIKPEIYFPYRQNPVSFWTQTSLVVTTAGDEQALLGTVAGSLRTLTPELPASQPRTLRQIYSHLLWQPRFSVSLLAVFAFAAIALAAIGVYGAMSYAAAACRRELGVRVAVGAERRHLVRLLVGRGLGSTLWGLGIGLAGAALLGGWLESQLHGVSPHDPATLAATALGIGAVALLAAYLPAARASRVDPVASLRQD